MQITEIVADGRFGDVVLRDATADEEAAMQAVFTSRILQDQVAAIAEGNMRTAMAQLAQANPQLAQLLYNIIAAAGLNSWVPAG